MDIRTTFFDALISQPKLASSRKPEEFLGDFQNTAFTSDSMLLQILSGGGVNATFPWTFDLSGMDCFMLLYTTHGSGKLKTEGHNYPLTPSSLLLLNCNQHFRLDITADPWEYQVFFLTGPTLAYYNQLLLQDNLSLINIPSYSDILMALEKLPSRLSDMTLSGQLFISDLLNHIITGCITALLQNSNPKQIPPYIKEMKELFDQDFHFPYTLDDLEDQLGISKYRLCREFGAAYDISPLQYLNKRRIEVAAYLLLNTSSKVHEIGSHVGIENTNHFIHLFKKFMDCTPSEYKQRMTK